MDNDDQMSVDTMDKEEENGPCEGCGCYKHYMVVAALLVRCTLLIHAAVAVWLVVSLTTHTLFWILLATLVLLLAETIFTVVKRGGQESRWICPCFLAYLAAVLPPIWLVELDRLDRFNAALNNNTNLTSLVQVNGLTIPIKLEPEVWVSVMEQTLLFLLVLCRWLLPRGNISRHELSQLLFVLMGIASDNIELFELFDETEVRQDIVLTYVILAVWSVSLLQFVFVLTATRNPQKINVLHDESVEDGEGPTNTKKKKRGLCEIMFTTEMWSLIFSVMVQDGPYAITRIYTVVIYNLLNYTIIFFICKNLLVISLVLYRLIIICAHKCSEHNKKDDEDDASSEKSDAELGRKKQLLAAPTRSIKVKPLGAEPVPLARLSNNKGSSDTETLPPVR